MAQAALLAKSHWQKAEQHLSKADVIMAQLIARHGSCRIGQIEYRPFHTLVASIISQQLSSKAADTIQKRVEAIVSSPFVPEAFRGMRRDRLRKAGLSQAKIDYILGLARAVREGRLDFEAFDSLDDHAVLDALTRVKGIGRWTAEMFLIFALRRADVVAKGDAGLQRAVKLLYGEKMTLEKVAPMWKPYSSVASWYLWRHLDGTL